MTVRRNSIQLGAAFLPYSTGYYAALSILAPLTEQRWGSAVLVGITLFVFAVGDGLGGLIFSRILHRFSYRHAMATSMAASAIGLFGFAVADTYLVGLVLLTLTAIGGSVFGILGRTLVAQTAASAKDRHRIFSSVQVAVNIGAAAGPATAGLLLAADESRWAFPVAAVLYCASAAVVLITIEGRHHPPATSSRWPVGRASISRIVGDPPSLQVLGLVFLGSILYRQFYSAYALQAAGFLGPDQRAALFWGNALLVAALQLPVSRLVAPFVDKTARAARTMAAGIAIFAVSLGLMGVLASTLTAFLLVMIVFSIAETVYTPTVATALAGIPAASPLEAFNVRQVVWTGGSGVGVILGGTLYLTVAHSIGPATYWLSVAGVTLAAALAVLLRPEIGKRRDSDADARAGE